jgi:hypothetical protein
LIGSNLFLLRRRHDFTDDLTGKTRNGNRIGNNHVAICGGFLMSMIDADTHVDECEDTWKKLEGTPYAKYIPVTIKMPA